MRWSSAHDVTLFHTALPEVLCLAPPPHRPRRIWLNAAILLLQRESEHIYTALMCIQSTVRHAVYPRRSRLAIAGWHSESVLNLLHPRLGRVILHMLKHRRIHGRSKRWRNGYICAGELRPIFRDVSATTPLAMLTTLRLQYSGLCRVKRFAGDIDCQSVGYARRIFFSQSFCREFGCTGRVPQTGQRARTINVG